MTAHNPIESATRPPLIRFGWLRAVLYTIATILIIIAVSVVTTMFLLMIPGVTIDSFQDNIASSPITMVTYAILLAAAYGVTAIFRIFIDRRTMGDLGLMFPAAARRDLVAGLAWGLFLASLTFAILWASGLIRIIDIQFPDMSMLWLLVTLLFAAMLEELVFRGYILANLSASMNKFVALGISSILFTLLHALNPHLSFISILNIFLAGILLGIYYLYRRNLWFPFALHVSWNFTQGAVWGSSVSGIESPSICKLVFSENELLSGGDFGFEGSLLTTIVMIAAAIVLWILYRKREAIRMSETAI